MFKKRMGGQVKLTYEQNHSDHHHPLLKKCTSLSQLNQIHAQIITTKHLTSSPNNTCLLPTLIRSYTYFNKLDYARILFDRHHHSCLLLWNFMIRAYSKTPSSQQSLYLFRRMLTTLHLLPDKFTFTSVITASSRHPAPHYGLSVHGLIIKNGYESDVYVSNSIVNLYSVFGKMDDARKVFDRMPKRDVVTWTSLLRGYSRCGEFDIARQLFDKMPVTNDVSWAVMIAACVGDGRYSEALSYFRDMLHLPCKAKPNEATLVCVLSACAHIGALDQGKWVHVYIDKSGVRKSCNISTALIDMYAKCGRIECATLVFNQMSEEKDVLTWSSMISGLAMHGRGKETLQIFSQMLDAGVKPDNIALLGVLNGCSHSGLVNEGCLVFYNMNRLWGVVPKVEHYGCLVDLLGRAGLLEKAFDVVRSMPIEPDVVAWRSLLSACRIHGDVRLGERIMDHITQLDPSSHGGGYVLLSNLYAYVGRWDSVTKLRKRIDESNHPGCSWIEVDGIVHEFLAADRFHPQILGIHHKLNEVLKRLSIEGGYVANTMQVLFDLSEEEKEQAVSLHSEKLAIAFGLMNTKSGTCIRISKNLRICEDCHSAMKAISRVFDREIVMRDRSRFHTFRQGNCSCMDYW